MKKDLKILVALGLLTLGVILVFILQGLSEDNFDFFFPRRAEKILAIIIAAYCIGYTAVTFQTITNNNILTPSIMGLDSLYLFMQTVVIFFFGSRRIDALLTDHTNFFISIFMMIGVSSLLYMILFRGDRQNIYFVVLAGLIFGTLFNGLATYMQVMLDPNEFLVLQNKMFANFDNINTSLLYTSLGIVFFASLFSIRDLSSLDAISLGRNLSISLGVNYKRVVFKNLIVIAVLISVATALVGPITFLGILVVSLARQMLNTYRNLHRAIAAVFIGIFSLVLGQFLLERVFSIGITVSVVINFIGGIYFIYLLLREAKVGK